MPNKARTVRMEFRTRRRGRTEARTAREWLTSVSPVTECSIGRFPVTRPDECVRMVARLREVGAEWRTRRPDERARRLASIRAALLEFAGPLVEELGREIGRPRVEAWGAEIVSTLRALRWLEDAAPPILSPRVLRRFPRRCVQEWAPYGVVGLLSAWNYPVFLALPQIAAALAAGNAVLWKPSQLALACSSLVQKVLERAGFSELVTVAYGGVETGRGVVRAGCDKYVLIGDQQSGRQILSDLGQQLRPAVAELSASDPMLVCADADVALAARSAVWSRSLGAGQTCMAPKRLYVAREVYGPFIQAVAEAVMRLRVGDPAEFDTEVGPLRTLALCERAEVCVAEAVARGARLLCGGARLPRASYYFAPTVLADCSDDMRLFREELLAPVLAITPFETPDEAVRRANRLEAGLSASLWTRDPRLMHEIVPHLRGSVVAVNDVVLPNTEPSVPFGGVGDSGYGRMRGESGLLEMVRTRVVDYGPPAWLPRWHLDSYWESTVRVLEAGAELEAASGRGVGRTWRKRLGYWQAIRAYRRGRERDE